MDFNNNLKIKKNKGFFPKHFAFCLLPTLSLTHSYCNPWMLPGALALVLQELQS